MRKRSINLEVLPKRKYGDSERVDWNKCAGLKVDFEYENIKGIVEILECIQGTKKIKIMYKEKEYVIGKSEFLKCSFGNMLGIITNDFKIKIGDTFKDEKRDITIIDREYRDASCSRSGKYKYYKYKCNKDNCGYEGWTTESHILTMNGGCSCCRGLTVEEHINSIWKTDPWMIELGVSVNDAKRYNSNSNKKLEVTCPICGNKKLLTPNKIYRTKTISCVCGDGVSFPEKFMFSVLKQLNVDFINQLTKTEFEWCSNFRYDFYIPYYDIIIETHGEQHYKNTGFRQSLEEVLLNDKYKHETAINNGVSDYIVINCQKANKEWIAKNILDSKLSQLFDLRLVNWEEAENYAMKTNIGKDICDYWNNKEEWETTVTIASNNIWGIKSPITILKYLKRGNKLGWCNYNPKEENLKTIKKALEYVRKPINVYRKDILVGTFNSLTELENNSLDLYGVKLYKTLVSNSCKNSQEYKGFTFEFTNKN